MLTVVYQHDFQHDMIFKFSSLFFCFCLLYIPIVLFFVFLFLPIVIPIVLFFVFLFLPIVTPIVIFFVLLFQI